MERQLWLVRDGSAPVLAALRTPPFHLVLGRPREHEALPALAESIAGTDTALPGVTAAFPEADECRDLGARRKHASAAPHAAADLSCEGDPGAGGGAGSTAPRDARRP